MLTDTFPDEEAPRGKSLRNWETAAAAEYAKMRNWKEYARCKGHNDEMYVASEEAQRRVVNIYCSKCPVRIDCLNLALVTREEFGVWGATGNQRRAMLKQLARTHPHTRTNWDNDVATSTRDMAVQCVTIRSDATKRYYKRLGSEQLNQKRV